VNASTSTLTYSVPAMSCGHCVHAITDEVKQVEGVSEVAIDLDTKLVVVTGPALNDAAIREAIVEAGFDAAP
jgi:copper chaperone